jgi:hypothetical protein
MDRQSTPSSFYANNDEFDAIDAKREKGFEELKSLIKAHNRSSSSSRRRSSAHASELPSSARSHRHRHHHRHEREGQELDTNNHSTTSPSTLASSPRDYKASSPFDTRHLRRQAPHAHQEKLPTLKDDYLKLHQVPYKDHLLRQLENTIQGSKSLDEYLMELKRHFR